MQPTDTLPDEFARFLAARRHRITELALPAAIDAMLAFYAEVRMEGCDMAHDGDMLLYQWGTYDWGRGRNFELDLTRQFIFGAGEDDEIWQLSLTFLFTPSPALAAVASGNRWCRSLDKRDDLRAFILASPAYAAACAAPILRVDLDWECAG